MTSQNVTEPRHDILEDCEVVIRPVPPEPEPAPAYDPLQARVVAGTIAEEVPPPPPPPSIPSVPAPGGLNLTNYYWRPDEGWLRKEARIRPVLNPYRGRWYVNRIADGAVDGTRVRGPYLVLNMGPETDWVTALPSGSLFGAVLISGSLYEDSPVPVTELLISEALRDDINRARSGGNPHFDIVANDSVAVFPSGSSPALAPRAVVGCTIPKLRVDATPILGVWRSEIPNLQQAGIWELRWMYHSPYTFHMPDLRSQVAWVLTPDIPAPIGSWEVGTFAYNNPDTPGESDYRAYRKLIREIADENAQPIESGFAPDAEALTVVPARLKQFLTDTNEILSRMTSDRNVIRYMHGKPLSPIYGVEFARTDGTTERPPAPKVAGGGGAGWFNPINGTFSSLPSPTTRTN